MKTYLPIEKDTFRWEDFKMTLSVEGYDSILGGPRPNGTPQDWYITESGNIQPPYSLGEWNFFDEKGKWFHNDMLEMQHHPHIFDRFHCHFKNKYELSESGEEHLYIITVFNPHYFTQNEKVGFSSIDDQFKNDIRNGKAAIVIFYAWEGYSGMIDTDGVENRDFLIVEEWRKRENFPPKSVHFFTGNLLGDKHPHNKDSGTVIHAFSTFDNWNADTVDEPIVDFKPDKEKYLYLSYNRNPRTPRIYLAGKLKEEDLLDKGIVSFGKPSWMKSENNTMRSIGIRDRDWAWLYRNLPLELDKNLHFNLACNITHNDFTKTFCSIVTETLIDKNTIFISEKIWKCLQVGHPFFVLGNRDTLDYLRRQGYQTFGEWFDESYDNIDDYRLRINSIVNEIRRLQKYSLKDLKTIRKEMKEVLEFNKKLHYKQLLERWRIHTTEKPAYILFKLFDIYEGLKKKNSIRLL